jgi:hypothetical protein
MFDDPHGIKMYHIYWKLAFVPREWTNHGGYL